MFSEVRVSRGNLSNSYQPVFGVSLFPLLSVNPSLKQTAIIYELKVIVKLQSMAEYNHVSDSTLDPNQQDYLRRIAFSAAPGNAIQVKIGDLVDPITHGIKNVSGGYAVDLRRLLVTNPEYPFLLTASEVLELRLVNALGVNDVVQWHCRGSVFVDDASGY